MVELAFGMAALLALAIIAIGAVYLARPAAAMRGFGLPLPEPGAAVEWWLRLKGVRDVASGIAVLALMEWGTPRCLGILLLADALIPAGDMLTILGAKGSRRHAFGVHGLTALLMIATAGPLIMAGGA